MKSFSNYIVNISQLKKNLNNIKNFLNNSKICAIVKADAYGIGAKFVCKAISKDVDFFGVANINEALSIRTYDKLSKILVLGVVDSKYYKLCQLKNISISITSIEQLEECVNLGYGNHIHLQLNTGMNRFGFRSMSQFKKALLIIENSNLVLEGIYSHLACKHADVLFTRKQIYKFNQFKKCVRNTDVIFHFANSFGTCFDNNIHYNMVRCGNLLYGLTSNTLGNKLIVNITSKIVHINNVKKGESIGYDRTFIAQNKMKVAVVPIGYADGFDRRLSNKFDVLIKGHKCRIVGNICMDVFMVDITNLDNCVVGDEVVILGKQGKNSIMLEDYSKVLDTSPYEVLLKFNSKRLNYIIKE